jgi:hypothetical protein
MCTAMLIYSLIASLLSSLFSLLCFDFIALINCLFTTFSEFESSMMILVRSRKQKLIMNIMLSKTSLFAIVGTTLLDHAAGVSSLKQIVENVDSTFNNDPSTIKNFKHGDECDFIDDTKTTTPHHNPDMILKVDTGVLNSSCGNSGVCVKDASSSTGGRCIVTVAGTFLNSQEGRRQLIACQFADGTSGTKCNGLNACARITDLSKIGCGSCNGNEACWYYNFMGKPFYADVIVGENSCNGLQACSAHIKFHVGKHNRNVVIGKGSW